MEQCESSGHERKSEPPMNGLPETKAAIKELRRLSSPTSWPLLTFSRGRTGSTSSTRPENSGPGNHQDSLDIE